MTNLQNSNMYPQELQLKLYQAFIFSVPILFTVILILLFYLFYFRNRFLSSPTLPTTSDIQPAQFLSTGDEMKLKLGANLKDQLSVILFDDDIEARDSQCCVCLGEFELKEELQQIPLCKHVFHPQCISHWLHSNDTCPLCRCSVIHVAKHSNSYPLIIPDDLVTQDDPELHTASVYQEEQTLEHVVFVEHVVILVGESSSTSSL